jgi:hypothetical protein
VDLVNRALSRLAAMPGVEAAALTASVPFSYSIGDNVKRERAAADSGVPATGAWVSGGYFDVMGIPLVAGRSFAQSELMAQPYPLVAIVSETLARRLFGGENPVGRRIFSDAGDNRADSLGFEVVGVVRDSRWASLRDEGRGPLIYLPVRYTSAGLGVFVLLRTVPGVRGLDVTIRREMADIAPTLPLLELYTLRQRIDRHLAQERLLARAFAALAAIAVTLAAIGLYSVIAFSVAQRRREIGIRMALGARVRAVMRLVFGQAGRLVVLGLLPGLATAVLASRLVASRLFGVTALEPAVYATAALAMLAVAAGAVFVPARAAARVDPVIALRSE